VIDDNLREMFAERETLVPEPGRTAARIAEGIPRRRRRRRITGAVLSAVTVVAVVTAVPLAIGRPDHSPAVNRTGTPGPSASPPAPTASPATLVPAPDPGASLAVSPGWLPATPTVTSANLHLKLGTTSIEYGFGGDSVREIGIQLNSKPPERVETPTNVGQRTEVDVDGHPAEQFTVVRSEDGTRQCTLSWQAGPQQWLLVEAVDVGTVASCTVALRVARNLVDRPLPLPRTVRAGMVPLGYTLAQTGTQVETWCPPSADPAHPAGCLTLRHDLGTEVLDGTRVTVRQHEGRVQRLHGTVTLRVPGYLRIEVPAPGEPLTDADLVRIAESVALGSAW
jgi:hypothetical protein